MTFGRNVATWCRVLVLMSELDVRDLGGRLHRLWVSIFLGIAGSLAVTLILPTRDHFPTTPGGCGFSHQDQGWLVEGGSPALMIAGAVALSVAANAVLGAIAKTQPVPPSPLPRAICRLARK